MGGAASRATNATDRKKLRSATDEKTGVSARGAYRKVVTSLQQLRSATHPPNSARLCFPLVIGALDPASRCWIRINGCLTVKRKFRTHDSWSVWEWRTVSKSPVFDQTHLHLTEFSTTAMFGLVYTIGGKLYSMPHNCSASVQVYDTGCNTWSLAAPMHVGRIHHSCTVLRDRLCVVGGRDSTCSVIDSVEAFDPDTNTWIQQQPLATARRYHSAVTLGSCLYVIGGKDSNDMPLDSVEVFDARTRKWTRGMPLPAVRHSHSSFVLDGAIVVVAGLTARRLDWLDQEVMASTIIYRPYEGWSHLCDVSAMMQERLDTMAPQLNSIDCIEPTSQLWLDVVNS